MARKTPYCKDSEEPLSIAGVYELSVIGRLTGAGQDVTTHHYSIPGLEETSQAWAAYLQGWWTVIGPKYLACLTSNFTLTGLAIRDMLVPGVHRKLLPIVEGGVGTLTGPAADYQTATQITFTT